MLFAIFILWTLFGVFKAITDSRLWGEAVIRPWLEKKGQRWVDWYDGKRGLFTVTVNQGYPWSADYWHFFDTMRALTAITAMGLAFGVSLLWWQIILFCWLCFWVPSFTLVYKVLLMKEWTFSKWLINNFEIWK